MDEEQLRTGDRRDDIPVQDQDVREEAQEDAALRGVAVGGALGGAPGHAAAGLIGGASLGVTDENDDPAAVPADAEDEARLIP